jgi:transposase-like protein
MKSDRKTYSGEWKAKIAVEAIKGQSTINEISSDYKVHPSQIMKWKKQALEQMPEIFSDKREKKLQSDEELKSKLYEQIGKLQVELDWVKKKAGLIG